MEDPPKGFHRLVPGGEVRLRYGYIIKCEEVVKDAKGKVIELKCSYDPESRSGTGTSKKKVKGTIHWVNARRAVKAEVRLYDRLFTVEDPASEENWLEHLNPESFITIKDALLEPSLAEPKPGINCQFERTGYFCVDKKNSKPGALVFNRTVTLKDSWAGGAKIKN